MKNYNFYLNNIENYNENYVENDNYISFNLSFSHTKLSTIINFLNKEPFLNVAKFNMIYEKNKIQMKLFLSILLILLHYNNEIIDDTTKLIINKNISNYTIQNYFNYLSTDKNIGIHIKSKYDTFFVYFTNESLNILKKVIKDNTDLIISLQALNKVHNSKLYNKFKTINIISLGNKKCNYFINMNILCNNT